jgi:D-amino-acid dehydrogenase
MIPWCIGVLEACDAAKRHRTAMNLGSLLEHADEQWQHTLEDLNVEVNSVKNGYLLLQEGATSPAARSVAKLRQEALRGKLQVEILDQTGALELEPLLSDSATIGGAHFFPEAWSVCHPGRLLDAMTGAFARMPNTRVVNGEGGKVTLIEPCGKAGRKSIVQTADGECIHDVDVVIIAAGAYSAELASQCGDMLPLDTERGYNIQFEMDTTSAPLLNRAVCNSVGGYIVSPMADGTGDVSLRSAGLVELGGCEPAAVPARFDQLERGTVGMFKPECFAMRRRDQTKDWLGFRPTLPDYLPVIGRSSNNPTGVLYAFGHQHIGLTLAAVTGKLIAELVVDSGAKSSAMGIDLKPFGPQRFRGRWWWGR